jgi:hypothetical protein
MNKSLLLIAIAVLVVVVAFALSARQKTREAGSTGEQFAIFQTEMDGRPVFASVNIALRAYPDKGKLPFFLSISIPLVNPTSDGLTTRSDANDLNAFEDSLESNLRKQGRFVFVGRVTWNGHRELLYYTQDQQPFVRALNSIIASKSTRPFAFVCERDEHWRKVSVWLERK